MRYTLRGIPASVDLALRRRAKSEGKSLNRVALEALTRGAGVRPGNERLRDLSDVAGRWRDDPELERALAEARAIDPNLWSGQVNRS